MAPQKDQTKEIEPVEPQMPSTVGFTPEQFQVLIGSMGQLNATTLREALRSNRKENPAFPEKSVFNPSGVFDDEGNALEPKVKLRRETFFVGVRLSEELMTEEEIRLCNKFTADKTARNGTWTATIEKHGSKERLYLSVPAKDNDDRMVLPLFTFICRELLDGPDAVNPDVMQKQIEDLQKKVRELELAKAG